MRKTPKVSMSMDCGIFFQSNNMKNTGAIVTLKNGEESVRWGTLQADDFTWRELSYIREKTVLKYKYDIGVVITLILSIIIAVITRRPVYGLRVYFLTLLAMYIWYSYVALRRDIKDKGSLKYHGAEHKVLNAYIKLKRVPNLDEAREFSRFHSYCGTNQYTISILSLVLYSVVTFIPFLKYQIAILFLGTIVIILMKRIGLLNVTQFITTKEPSDQQLELAIKGLSIWEENEKR